MLRPARSRSTFVSERENVDEDICAMGSGPTAVEVDLMQPLDPENKPAVHATPLNHVGLWVDDLPRAVEWMTAHGVRFAPGGIRKGAAGHDICFIHPQAATTSSRSAGEGVLIELVQAPPEVVAALDDAPGPHRPPPSDSRRPRALGDNPHLAEGPDMTARTLYDKLWDEHVVHTEDDGTSRALHRPPPRARGDEPAGLRGPAPGRPQGLAR
jgi:lactoylglutathione lyase